MSLTQFCLVFLQQRHIGTNLRLPTQEETNLRLPTQEETNLRLPTQEETNLRLPTQEDGEGLASTLRLHWLFYLLCVAVCFLTSDDKQPVKKVQTQGQKRCTAEGGSDQTVSGEERARGGRARVDYVVVDPKRTKALRSTREALHDGRMSTEKETC
ncbi:hypothetical protein JOQ06_020486 [Pogonophryne albipinna]|uniref:Uncharacterized protein n=1 Tax=Pogonophryne albipinna TaxID=1090488 RepID=A0AAD6FVK7_9TELE|nr:hypothetical protein JOQ06_020486 [Pogonophryne albipinna]